MKKTTLSLLLTLVMTMSLLQAQTDQEKIEAQALEIKQLKRALKIKEEELKILLITIKNSKQESMLHSTEQHLKFKNVDNVTPTRVVVKPSMLSETAIKEIDQGGYTDTDVIEDNLNKASSQDQEAMAQNEMDETDAGVESDKKEVAVADKEVLEEPKEVDEAKAVKKEIEKLTFMKPSTFTVVKATPVYSKIYGPESEAWEKGMRFTSNKRRGSWIQITGKITNSRWKAVKTELWIDESNVKKVR